MSMGNSKLFTKIILRNFFFLLSLFLFSLKADAQTFPVQLNAQLVPPLSGYVTDYASPGNENFRLIFLFTDFSRPSYDLKLKIKIQGQGITIQSPSWFFSGPVSLEPGVPKMLSGYDLSDLLNENNLEFSGITRAQYDVAKVLPEGFYTITVTAYDFLNPLPIQVSNEGIAQAWMVLNDPPYLNLPFCGNEVTPQDPQQITFSWTAMNLAAPSSALGSEYTFELWEIFPANQSPGNIIASTPPLYSYTTQQTLVNYGITEPPLVVGRQYVWRVHAHDLENRELFRNNGYSSLCTFTYGNTFNLLGNSAQLTLTAQALSSRQALCHWDSLSIYANYRIEFRKVGTTNWFPFTTNHASLRIPDLEANTNYEAQVTGMLPSGTEGPVSNLATWHTPEKPVYACGESAPPPSQQNFHPLTQASTGMIWQIGQFEMMVTSLNGNANTAGWYSGLGKVVMPLGWTLACSFSGIQVGEDHVVYSGEVRAITEGASVWLTQYQLNNMLNTTDYSYNGNIDTVFVSNGMIIIQGDDGPITISTYEPPYTIQGGNGTTYTVMPDGSVVITNLVPHIELSQQQKNVYIQALMAMRSENSLSLISQLEQQNTNAQNALRSKINTDYGLDYNDQNATPQNPNVFVEVIEYDSTQPYTHPMSEEMLARTAEFNLIKAKVCRTFSKPNPSTFDLDLLANFLYMNGQPSYLYIAQQLSLGTSVNALADETKIALDSFIEETLLSTTFKKPQPK
jgi:hypothetical protein